MIALLVLAEAFLSVLCGRFMMGYIEKINELGLPDNSLDDVVSNCVINLSPDKPAVLR